MSCDQEPRNVELRCKVCSKIFDRRSRLESHRKIHSGDRPFSCPFCEKKFLSRGNCNTHIKVHTKERPYRCPYCNKSFSQNGQLTIHIRHHTGEKPFVCSYCSKGFSCSKVMKIHMRTHTGEKPFLCEFCNKGFAAYANLVVHKRIHTGERPYSCSLCGKCFEHSGNLRRHRKVHKVENGGFRCIPCGQVFEEENNLLNHSLKMHPNEYIKDEGDFNAQKELNKILPFSSDSQVTTTEENCTSINGKSEIEIMDHEENTNYSSNNSTSLSIESSESPGVQVSSSVDDLQNSEAMRSNSHKGNINSQNSSHSPEGINPLTIKIKLPKKKFRKRNLKTCHNSVDILGGKITEVRKNSLINISSSYTIQSIDENSSALDTLANIANQSEKIDTAVKNPCETKETLRYSDVCVELLPNKSNKRNHELNISSGHKSEPCNKKITSIPSLIPIDSDKNFSIYNDEHLPRPAKFQKVNNEQLLTTLRKNIQSFIQNILPTMNLWSSFKEKVELILIALIGETNMEEFGYPKRTTEQVIIDILDLASKTPCADVRVDELQRLKINFRKFLDYFLPPTAWDDFGGNNCSIETLVDNLFFSIGRNRTIRSNFLFNVNGLKCENTKTDIVNSFICTKK